MSVLSNLRPAVLRSLAAMAITFAVAGCGFQRLDPTLPAAIPGFTFEDLKAIQDDPALTQDEKRQRIREAVGAPDDDSGDRLVEFLLNFNVP
jgi:hypothetical protein